MTFRSEDLFVALEQCPIWLPSPYPEGPAGLVLTFEVGTYGAIRSINGNVRFGVTLWIEGSAGPADKLTVNLPELPLAGDEFFVKRDGVVGRHRSRLREALLSSDLFFATDRAPVAQGFVHQYAETWRFRRRGDATADYVVLDPAHQAMLRERVTRGREETTVRDAERRLKPTRREFARNYPEALLDYYTRPDGLARGEVP